MAFRSALLGVLILFAGELPAADVVARLHWSQRVPLGSCASALVHSVRVDVGDRVSAGDVLVELDPVPAQARLARARATLARVRPELEEQTIELEHAQELFDRTVLSAADLRHAEIRHAVAEAGVAEAAADVAVAEAGVECRKVRSPLTGIVVERAVERGQAVVGRERALTLVVVAETGQMDAVAEVPSDLIGAVPTGVEVAVRVGSELFRGRVVTVGLEPTSTSPLVYPVRVRFPTPEGRQLRAGMPAIIQLP